MKLQTAPLPSTSASLPQGAAAQAHGVLEVTRADTGHDVEAVGERIERVTLTRVQIEGQQLDQLVELCLATLVQTAPWSHAV